MNYLPNGTVKFFISRKDILSEGKFLYIWYKELQTEINGDLVAFLQEKLSHIYGTVRLSVILNDACVFFMILSLINKIGILW